MDRRFDITDPSRTQRFKIKEYFDPSSSSVTFDPEKIMSRLRLIMNSKKKGETEKDILIFAPGEQEISKIITEITEKENFYKTIALPLHSKVQDFISELCTSRSAQDVNIKQEDIHKRIDQVTFTKGKQYETKIIVATNIAEASTTFPNLGYMIETGLNKVSIYNPKTRFSTLSLLPISEVSRLQRRGRVGRTMDGTIYYTYPKELVSNKKVIYSITISDFSDNLFNLLLPSTTPKNKAIIDQLPLNKSWTSKEVINFENKLSESIGKKDKELLTADGIAVKYLYDSTGKFYVIHPNDKDNKERDMNNSIFLESLSYNPNNLLESSFRKLTKLFLYNPDTKTRTLFGDFVHTFIKDNDFILSIPSIVSLMYSYKYEVLPETLAIVMMMEQEYSIGSWLNYSNTSSGSFIKGYNEAMNLYSSKIGDHFTLLNIHNHLMKYIGHLFTCNYNPQLHIDISDLDTNQLRNLKERGIDIKSIKNNYIEQEDLLNKFSIKYGIKIDRTIPNNVKASRVFKAEIPILKKWCDLNLLNYIPIRKYLRQYKNKLSKFIQYMEENDGARSKTLSKILPSVSKSTMKEKNIFKSLVYGHFDKLGYLDRETRQLYTLTGEKIYLEKTGIDKATADKRYYRTSIQYKPSLFLFQAVNYKKDKTGDGKMKNFIGIVSTVPSDGEYYNKLIKRYFNLYRANITSDSLE